MNAQRRAGTRRHDLPLEPVEEVRVTDQKTTTKTAYLYTLADPRTGEVRYVGWTSLDPHRRLRCHLAEAKGHGGCHRLHWIRQLMSIGLHPVQRIAALLEVEDGPSSEIRYIAALRACGIRLTNCTDGGDGAPGRTHYLSEDAKKRIGVAQRGRKATPEARLAMSRASKGKKKSTEHRVAISLGRIGKKFPALSLAQSGMKHTPERREANSRAHLGHRPSQETRAKMSASQKKRWQRNNGVVEGALHAFLEDRKALKAQTSQKGNAT